MNDTIWTIVKTQLKTTEFTRTSYIYNYQCMVNGCQQRYIQATMNFVTDLQTGQSKTTAGPGETSLRGPSRDKFFWIVLVKWRILVYFIFLSNGRAPKHYGACNNLPPYPSPWDGPAYKTRSAI